ncbi:hypothetical protein [Fictibacillus fluitans]|uniref:DUF4352 domain-containing protein n=1 Tax=Fictibacillus fluitans TaxID=3058422 RepID=A0ABT8I3X4_9BACL|nr:hypothetical protein [Fictibacillus sp. NE201]MDN4527728.1 hypothetical protein [Fictibacillus sp. NE201]
MKKLFFNMSFCTLLLLLGGCSSKPEVTLTKASAVIIHDKDITGSEIITEGERKGEDVVPTSLYYKFVLKNTGDNKVGGIHKDKQIKIKIQPRDSLAFQSKQTVVFNIFKPWDYEESGLGYGASYPSELKENKKEDFALTYDVGGIHVPSAAKLKKLKSKAMDATLVVYTGKEEIARFDLRQYKK